MGSDEHGELLKQELARLRAKEAASQQTIKALQEEFAQAGDPEEVTKVARKAIVELMPIAIAEMRDLIQSAESESVRAGLARFVVGTALDKTKFEDSSGSELKELLKQLAANDPNPS